MFRPVTHFSIACVLCACCQAADLPVEPIRLEVDRYVREQRFSGVILVAQGEKVLFSTVRGFAEMSQHRRNTAATRFNLASLNEMFTGVAVAQLAQRGDLEFSDNILRRLVDYPNQEVASRVTVHQLLTHTSGLRDLWPDFEGYKGRLRDPEDYIQIVARRPLQFSPGIRWSYSNFGFTVLKAIVERVSGESYDDYIQKYIFDPAGMTSTVSQEKPEGTPELAIGYTRDGRSNEDMLPRRGAPSRGGYSTAGDLLRFANALRGQKLLNKQYTELVMTGKINIGRGSRYGYGFGEQSFEGRKTVGNGGGLPGISTQLHIFPDTGHVIIVLANGDPPIATELARTIAYQIVRAGSPAVAAQ